MTTKRKPRKNAPSAAAKPHAPLGRYLRKFTLQNVRTFRSPVTLDFCHPDGSVAQWTVILGENGTGKTTLLQYLAGMMPVENFAYDVEANTFIPVLAGSSWQMWNLKNLPYGITETSEQRFGYVGIEGRLKVTSAVSGIDLSKDDDDECNTLSLSVKFQFIDQWFGSCENSIWMEGSPEFPNQFRLFGYGASRHVASAVSPYISSDTFLNGSNDPTSTLYYDDHPLISPEQWLLGLDHSFRNGGRAAKTAKRALASARRCFINALPGVFDMNVKPYSRVRRQPMMTLMYKTAFGEVPFSSLSLGYRTMAAWLTDFVKRMHEAFPNLEEPDNGPAIVLIDEFDLHMHPKWQREAMAALSKEFPNTQFIVTAHSPLIVQATEGNAKLIVLRRFQREDGTEEVLVDDHPRYAAGWRVDQILSSDLYNLDPRSPKYDALMEENIRLRQKERRTAKEEKRLREIEAELEREAPPGTSSASKQLFADLERALQEAHKNGK